MPPTASSLRCRRSFICTSWRSRTRSTAISVRRLRNTAIFAVATTIVGIWGMNFEYMPELKWTYGYPFAVALIGVVCGVLYYRFRRAKWL